MTQTITAFLLALVLAIAAPAMAPSAMAQDRGPVTNLPLPRFVSLKAAEANIRRGPSLSHRIDWVFQRRGMPLQVVAEYGHWRQVRDQDGIGGWIHFRLLSGSRTALTQAPVTLRARAEGKAPVIAQVEPGVVLRLDRCDPTWCKVTVRGHKGWVTRGGLWGLGDGEIID